LFNDLNTDSESIVNWGCLFALIASFLLFPLPCFVADVGMIACNFLWIDQHNTKSDFVNTNSFPRVNLGVK
jgi:hypothetical protein